MRPLSTIENDIQQNESLHDDWNNFFDEKSYQTRQSEIQSEKETEKDLSLKLVTALKDKLNGDIFDTEEYYNTCYSSKFTENMNNYLTADSSDKDNYLEDIKEHFSYYDLNEEEIDFIIEEYKKDLSVSVFDENWYKAKEIAFFNKFWSEKWKNLLGNCDISCPKGNEYLTKKLNIFVDWYWWLQKRKAYKKLMDVNGIKARYDDTEFLPWENEIENKVIDRTLGPVENYETYDEIDEIYATWTIDDSHIKYSKIEAINTNDIVWSTSMQNTKLGFVNKNIWGNRDESEMNNTIHRMETEWFQCFKDQIFYDDMVKLKKIIGFNWEPLYFVVNWNHRTIAAKSLNIPKIIAEVDDVSVESNKEKVLRTNDRELVNDRKYRISKWYIDWKIIEDEEYWEYKLIYSKWCFDGCCLSKSNLYKYMQSYIQNIWGIDDKNMDIIRDMLNH